MGQRNYSLFYINLDSRGKKSYTQASDCAFPKFQAVRVSQNRLLAGALRQGPLCELRPVKKDSKTHFTQHG